MNKILIAYATNSGGTLTVAQLIGEKLKEKGFEVLLKDIREVKKETLPEFDLIIFGSPSWDYNDKEGQPHEFFTKFMEDCDGVKLKKVAVFGLGDTAYLHFCGAVDYIENFVKKNGGEIAVESLRIDGFFFSQKENEERALDWTYVLTGNVTAQKTAQN
jgi:flavodoxin short chain